MRNSLLEFDRAIASTEMGSSWPRGTRKFCSGNKGVIIFDEIDEMFRDEGGRNENL